MNELSPAALIEKILTNPPMIHPTAPSGIWSTEISCYRLLAEYAVPGARSIETGCGVSTIVLAARGAHHTCVTPEQEEADGVLAWGRDNGVDLPNLEFLIGKSDEVLPTLDRSPLDLVFIDGWHRFPVPMIDWFYTARRLRTGGVVVLDDLQLPSPNLLAEFLAESPIMRTIERTSKWGAFQIVGELSDPKINWKQVAGASLIRGGPMQRLGRRGDKALERLGRLTRPRSRR